MSTPARHARDLVEAVLLMHDEALWNVFEEDDAVAFEIPGEERPLAALVLGQSGYQFGLTLFPGGLRAIDAMFATENDAELEEAADEITVLVNPLRDIPPPLRGLLDDAGWSGRRDALAPHVIVKYRGKFPRSPRPREVRIALYAVKAMLYAHDRGKLDPRPYNTAGGVQLLRVSGQPHAPVVEYGTHRDPDLARRAAPAGAQPTRAASAVRRDLPVAWMAGIFPLTTTVHGDERALDVLLVVEANEGRVLVAEMLPGDDPREPAALLLDYARGNNEYGQPLVPREIRFRDRDLLATAGRAFEESGTRAMYSPRQPELEALALGLEHHLSARLSEIGDADIDASLGDFFCDVEDGLVERHELDAEWEEWSEALDELIDLTGVTLRARKFSAHRLYGRYAGDADFGCELFAEDPPDYLAGPLTVWMLACYRPQRNSKTALEIILGRKRLPDRVRELAENIRDATPSLYEVVTRDGSVATLRDLATREVLEEVLLPLDVRVGSLWPGLVHAAGPFRFLAPIGPAVPPRFAAQAPGVLARHGIALEPEALAAHNHFGGLLAAWLEEIDAYGAEDPREERDAVATDADRLMELHREMQLRWLDAPIPRFGGKTPREVCRTRAGRIEVAELIKTMSNPSPQIPEAVHQDIIAELLDELGLA